MSLEGSDTDGMEHSFYGNERFELLGCLGEGAYGVVYRAHDRVRDAHVALKVLRHLAPDTIFYFKREFRALADLEHPNLVRYRELFEEHGRWFLTMDLVHGLPLVEHVRGPRHVGPIDAEQEHALRTAFAGLAAGLRALHAAGKVHRDVKPSNLCVDAQGRVVLLDFGLVTDYDALQSVRFPADGTATYMAPEQVDSTQVGPEADWYAVGAMLYECLTGRAPFVGDPMQVLQTKRVQTPRAPRELVERVPEDLQALCLGLLAIRPEERAPAIASFERRVAVEPAAGVATRPQVRRRDFVGREEDLSGLQALVLDPAAPPLTFAYVHGDTGLGKTALLTELERRLTERHPEVLLFSGRCYEREAVPYKALDGVLDELAHYLRGLSPEAARSVLPRGCEKLVRAFPVFGRVRAIDRSPIRTGSSSSRGARRRAFEVLRELLVRVGAQRRLVIVIDDLHWADADSLALLDALFCSGAPPACVLLCAGRTRPSSSEPVAQTIERLSEAAQLGVQLRLAPLRRGDAYTLALRSLRQREDASTLSHLIAKESAGHPLFVDALVRHALQGPAQAPVSLEAALHSVHDGLPDDARRLCRVLALTSVPLTRESARAAARLSWASLDRSLRALGRVGWVRLLRADGRVSVELCHDRVRALVISTLAERVRAEIHWEIAQALVDQDADPEAIAIHFAEAGDAERACRYATRGAEAAARSFAFAHAERLYLLALTNLPSSETARRRQLERELARVHQWAGRGRQAGDLYAELSRGAPQEEALELRYLAAQAWLDAGHHEEGVPWLTLLLHDLGVDVQAAGMRRRLEHWSARLTVVLRKGAFRLGEKPGPRELLTADSLWTLTCALLASDLQAAREVQWRHLGYALELGDAYRLCRAFAMQGWMQQARQGGDRLLQSDELESARKLALVADVPHAHALVTLAEGVGEFLEDRYARAEPLIIEAERILREECTGVRWERTNSHTFVALCAFNRGDWRALQRHVDAALSDAELRDDAFAGQLWRSRLGHLGHLLRGNAEAAVVELLEAPAGRREGRVPVLADVHATLSLVEVSLYRNDVEVFDSLNERWSELERAGQMGLRMVRQRVYWARARAALCSARLLSERRPALLAEARAALAGMQRDRGVAVHATVLLLQAACLEVEGRDEAARLAYRQAAAASEAAGLAPLVAVADGRRGALTPGHPGQLLQRQAHDWLRAAGASDPARMAAVLNGF